MHDNTTADARTVTRGSEESAHRQERTPYAYVTHLDIQFPRLSRIDAPALVTAVTDAWFNQRLCRVQGSVARLSGVQDEYKRWALILPPIPPLLVALFVYFRRRSREQEGVSRSRLR